MRANKWCRGLTAFLAASMLAGMYPSSAAASDYKLGYNTNASENDYVFTTKSPKGTIGKSMSIPFRIRATDEDMENLRISLLETNEFQQIEERGNGDYSVDYYPFEIMETTFVAKNVGTCQPGCGGTPFRDTTASLYCLNGTVVLTQTILMYGFPPHPHQEQTRRRTKRKAITLWWERTSPPPGAFIPMSWITP